MDSMDVTTKAFPRLMLPCNVVLGYNLTMVASKTTEQPALLHSEACFCVCKYYAKIYEFLALVTCFKSN